MTAATATKTTTSNGAVTLWTADNSAAQWLMAQMNILSNEDRTEFAAIAQPAARFRSMSARILLRVALSDAVNGTVAPAEWTFVKEENGKKRIADGLPMVHFSVSHNDEMAVVATSLTNELGVDVEANTTKVDEATVNTFLAISEIASLNAANDNDRDGQFVRFWTLKEAFTKLTGEGLSADFTAVEFAANDNTLIGNDTATFERFEIANCQIALAIAA